MHLSDAVNEISAESGISADDLRAIVAVLHGANRQALVDLSRLLARCYSGKVHLNVMQGAITSVTCEAKIEEVLR